MQDQSPAIGEEPGWRGVPRPPRAERLPVPIAGTGFVVLVAGVLLGRSLAQPLAHERRVRSVRS